MKHLSERGRILSYQQFRLSHEFLKTSTTLPKSDFVSNDNVGLFQIPQLTNPIGLNEVSKKAIRKSKKLLEDIEKVKPGLETIKIMDEVTDILSSVADLADFIRAFHPEEKYQHAASEAHLNIATMVEQLQTDFKLFKLIQRATNEHSSDLDEESRMVAELLLSDFNIAGVIKREKSVKSHADYIKEGLISAIIRTEDNFEPESKNPILQSMDPRIQRKALEFLVALSHKVSPIFILSRHQLTNLNLNVKDIHRQRSKFDKLEAWNFYASKLQCKSSNFDHCKISSYFSLSNCMQGLSNLFKSLYGVKFQYQKESKGELWSEDVVKLAVVDDNNDVIGYIYCDFLDRKGKPQQNYQLTIQNGRRFRDGLCQLPKVVVCLNLNHASSQKPTLLTPNSLSNLFHEMGHAMHSILTRSVYQNVTNTKFITEFSEVPAILMEFFAKDPTVLKSFARHYKTGEVISSEILDLMSDLYKEEQAAQMHLKYSPINECFGYFYGKISLFNVVWLERYIYKFISSWTAADRILQCKAMYYANYLVSRAIASKLWKECFKKDPFNREAGERYRKILSLGGNKNTEKMYEKMLGEKICIKNLIETLIKDFCRNCGYNDV